MQRYAVVYKEVGETPLEALERVRTAYNLAPTVPLAYAGRLDPMASGVLVVLIGDECKRQTTYHGYDKEYRFEILLGFGTDTGDILGIPTQGKNISFDDAAAHRTLSALRGTHTFRYPRFSARTVDGIPLHEWTLRGGLPDERIPMYTADIHRIRMLGVRTVTAAEIRTYIHERIGRIPPVTDPRKALGADFRRGDILPRWDALLAASHERWCVVQASAVVSSGTYIRTVSEAYGKAMGTHALAYSIERTRIGTYHQLPFGFGLWMPTIASLGSIDPKTTLC